MGNKMPIPSSFPSVDNEIFDASSENTHYVARLDYVFGSGWYDYATGYKEAADILVEHAIEDTSLLETLVFPIVFSYRQYIELKLKQIIVYGRKLFGDSKSFPDHHKLSDLWNETREIIEKVWTNDSTSKKLQVLNEYILQFQEIDPYSFEFRYPVKRNGSMIDTLKFRWQPAQDDYAERVNIKQLKEVMDIVARYLDIASAAIRDYLEQRQSDHNP